jgi:dedicator of cytokinesis protein 3
LFVFGPHLLFDKSGNTPEFEKKMPAPLLIAPKWKALPRMGYGIVTYPFRPLSDSQFSHNLAANGRPPSSKRDIGFATFNLGRGTDIAAQQLSLDLGDEVYVFEQADGWYRGYVVTSVTPPVILSTSSSSSSHGPTMKIATEVKGLMEPKVYVGIFPANYVCVKEYVSDALGILANGDEDDEEYNSANASKRSSFLSVTSAQPRREMSVPATPPLPPLPAQRVSDKVQKPSRNLSNASRKTEKSRISRQTNKSTVNPAQRAPPLPALKVGDDTEAGLEEPLVDEVSAALREWHGLLLGIFLKKKYQLFEELSGLILKLERARRDLLSGLLTKSETIQLRREIVVMLNVGNKMLPGSVLILLN